MKPEDKDYSFYQEYKRNIKKLVNEFRIPNHIVNRSSNPHHNRIGDWMQTYGSPGYFYPLDPRPEEVSIEHIAHALSLLCRYNGACNKFYSVAEHCWHVSHHVIQRFELFGLLHDAAEAYIGDMIRPIKKDLPIFRNIEWKIEKAIWEHFGLIHWVNASVQNIKMQNEIKRVDNAILVDEHNQNMQPSPLPWNSIENVPSLGVKIRCWKPKKAEKMFLKRFYELQHRTFGTGIKDAFKGRIQYG